MTDNIFKNKNLLSHLFKYIHNDKDWNNILRVSKLWKKITLDCLERITDLMKLEQKYGGNYCLVSFENKFWTDSAFLINGLCLCHFQRNIKMGCFTGEANLLRILSGEILLKTESVPSHFSIDEKEIKRFNYKIRFATMTELEMASKAILNKKAEFNYGFFGADEKLVNYVVNHKQNNSY